MFVKGWYTISELTKRWGRTESEIEGYLETKALKATTRQGIVNPEESHGVHQERSQYISRLIPGPGPLLGGRWGSGYPPGTQLIITSEEVERFEVENNLVVTPFEAPYLDPSHEHFSEELAVAVKTWLVLYGTGGKYKPKGMSHKSQIEGQLKDCGLSGAAVDRIATVVNPNKRGGAPVSHS